MGFRVSGLSCFRVVGFRLLEWVVLDFGCWDLGVQLLGFQGFWVQGCGSNLQGVRLRVLATGFRHAEMMRMPR